MTPSFEGNLFTKWHEIWSQETRDSTLSYSENLESISMTLIFNRLLEVVEIHVQSDNAENNTAIVSAGSKNLVQGPLTPSSQARTGPRLQLGGHVKW